MSGRKLSLAARLTLVAVVLLAIMAIAYNFVFPAQIGKAQPVPFSHRFHVTEKKLSCLMCHPGAISREVAGIPPLETCMLCHQHVIIHYPEIVKVRDHYQERKPIEWVRINNLPDFVYFNHQVHVRSGYDCGKCHGDVAHMDRIVQVHPFKMGFCVECHRQENASHDCLICHR